MNPDNQNPFPPMPQQPGQPQPPLPPMMPPVTPQQNPMPDQQQGQPVAFGAAPSQPPAEQQPSQFAQPAMPGQAMSTAAPAPDMQQSQPLPAQSQPQQPGVFGPAMPYAQQPGQQPAQMPGQPVMGGQMGTGAPMPLPMSPSSKSRLPLKLILLVAGVVGVIGILLGIVFVVMGAMATKYTASSLVGYSTNAYSASYPKPWKDQTSNSKLLKNMFGDDTSSGIDDMKIYAYRLNKAGDSAQSIMLTGDTSSFVTDKELQEALKSSSARSTFESEMSKSADSLSENAHCQSASNKTNSVKYDTDRYVAEINMALDCKLSAADQKSRGVDTIHLQIQMGAKNGKFYMMMVGTDLKDWKSNSNFYLNNLVPSLKPKA